MAVSGKPSADPRNVSNVLKSPLLIISRIIPKNNAQVD